VNPALTSSTRLIALLGNPVAHSVSPIFQNAAFREAGVDGVYLALRCDAEAVPELLRAIAAAGGGGNVTVPHKEIAARSLDRATGAVRRTGACNTYWLENGAVHGDNTDVVGSARAIRALAGSIEGARVLLVGGGGAARAALAALADEGASEVVLLNRTRERAVALAERFANLPMTVRVAADEKEIGAGGFHLAVNATPLGLHPGDPEPLSEDLSSRVEAGFDMVYRPGGTPWVRRLANAGTPAADGREMLLWQGVAAFERWWPVPAPIEVMRRALLESMA
jgi:shikimate dehydrogenase